MEKFDKATKYILGICAIMIGGITLYHTIAEGINFAIVFELLMIFIGICIFHIKED